MRILLVADGRSPITRNWIRMVSSLDHHVFLLSTFPHEPISDVDGCITLPVGFSSFAGGQVMSKGSRKPSLTSRLIGIFRPLLMRLRSFLTVFMMPRYQAQFLNHVDDIKPDIVHALRIPFEGMLAVALPKKIPLIISIWGNDLSLHARSSKLMAKWTGDVLLRADGLLADAASDIQLAGKTGLREAVPTIVVPGCGGLDLRPLQAAESNSSFRKYGLPVDGPLIVNPRGFRPGSVHQDVFFQSIPMILEEIPDAHFVCTGMRGQPRAEKWLKRYRISANVSLLPFIPQGELWELFCKADVYISLSSHDGTPNSFLEAIACGCFPVVGDILSLREWIDHGENGWLVDPQDARAAADAVISVLGDKELRDQAAVINQGIAADRVDIHKVEKVVRIFYEQFE